MPDLLAEARELFAAPNMTEEQAAAAIRAAHADAGKFKAAAKERDDARTELADARNKLAAAEAKVPKAVDVAVAAGRIDLAAERVDLMVEKGSILPPQAAVLKEALKGADGKPATATVNAEGAVLLPVSAVAAAFALNKPAGLLGEATGAQGAHVVNRVVPGAEGADPGPETVSADRKAELLAMAGMGAK